MRGPLAGAGYASRGCLPGGVKASGERAGARGVRERAGERADAWGQRVRGGMRASGRTQAAAWAVQERWKRALGWALVCGWERPSAHAGRVWREASLPGGLGCAAGVRLLERVADERARCDAGKRARGCWGRGRARAPMLSAGRAERERSVGRTGWAAGLGLVWVLVFFFSISNSTSYFYSSSNKTI